MLSLLDGPGTILHTWIIRGVTPYNICQFDRCSTGFISRAYSEFGVWSVFFSDWRVKE